MPGPCGSGVFFGKINMAAQRDKLRILFLCTGNSCRSQMAEAWLRHLTAGRIVALSAGTDPVGINPRAVAVMEELVW